MIPRMEIAGRPVGPGQPVYIVAELSANHQQQYEKAEELVRAAAAAGADAVKVQTYTPETLTFLSSSRSFQVAGGTPWDGQNLFELYTEGFMPWEWQPRLQELAHSLGLHFFSTAYDGSAVEFLERLQVPVHKIASFEIVDLPLIARIARTGKPMILSTGMATLDEIGEAVETARKAGAQQIALLKCTSAYPAPVEDMNLRTLGHLAETFQVPVGLSDHTLEIVVSVAAVALGATIIEKHLTLSREERTLDAFFSLEPHEFKNTVQAVRTAEKALGKVSYGPTEGEKGNRALRRSLIVVQHVKAGERLTEAQVRSLRPGHGLAPKYLSEVVGRTVSRDLAPGSPLQWNCLCQE